MWLARQWENQKRYYLKRNIQREFPAGILEKALSGIKCQSFLASSCFPEKEGKKRWGRDVWCLYYCLFLPCKTYLFVLEERFPSACHKISAVRYVSWPSHLRTGLRQEYQTDTSVQRCIPRALQGPRAGTAAAEGRQRQNSTAFHFW